jgi:hypothetical protein
VNRHFKGRYWLEVVGSSVSASLLGVTLVWPNWIELVFRVDADRGSGLLEWLIVVVSLTVSVCASVLARREWRRAMTPGAQIVEGAGQGSGGV